MPHIAAYMKEAMEEEKYGEEFNGRIDIRAQEMNTAQLQRMFDYLNTTASTSGFHKWGSANTEIASHIEKVLKVRLEEEKVLAKQEEAIENKIAKKMDMERMKNQETKRVLKMIKQNAVDEATKKVKEDEIQRQSDERVNMIHAVAEAEAVQRKIVAGIIIFIAAACTGVSMSTNDVLWSAAGYGIVFVVVVLGCYWAYKVVDIKPLVVTDEDIEAQIETVAAEYIDKAMAVLHQKELAFQEKVKREKVERKHAVQERKERKIREKEEAERKRLEVLKITQELEAKQKQEEDELLRKMGLKGSKSKSKSRDVSMSSSFDGAGSGGMISMSTSRSRPPTALMPSQLAASPLKEETDDDEEDGNGDDDISSGEEGDKETVLISRSPTLLESMKASMVGMIRGNRSGEQENASQYIDLETGDNYPEVDGDKNSQDVDRARGMSMGFIRHGTQMLLQSISRSMSTEAPPYSPTPGSRKNKMLGAISPDNIMLKNRSASSRSLFGDMSSKPGSPQSLPHTPAPPTAFPDHVLCTKDILRIVPTRLQCVDMKETFANDIVLVVSVQSYNSKPSTTPDKTTFRRNSNNNSYNFTTNSINNSATMSTVMTTNTLIYPNILPIELLGGVGSKDANIGNVPGPSCAVALPYKKSWYITDTTLTSTAVIKLEAEKDKMREMKFANSMVLSHGGVTTGDKEDGHADDVHRFVEEGEVEDDIHDGDIGGGGSVYPNYSKSFISAISNFKQMLHESSNAVPVSKKASMKMLGRSGSVNNLDYFGSGSGSSSKLSSADPTSRIDVMNAGLIFDIVNHGSSDWLGDETEENNEYYGMTTQLKPSSGLTKNKLDGCYYSPKYNNHPGHNHHGHKQHTNGNSSNEIDKAMELVEQEKQRRKQPGVLCSTTFVTVALYLPFGKMSKFMQDNVMKVINAALRVERQVKEQEEKQMWLKNMKNTGFHKSTSSLPTMNANLMEIMRSHSRIPEDEGDDKKETMFTIKTIDGVVADIDKKSTNLSDNGDMSFIYRSFSNSSVNSKVHVDDDTSPIVKMRMLSVYKAPPGSPSSRSRQDTKKDTKDTTAGGQHRSQSEYKNGSESESAGRSGSGSESESGSGSENDIIMINGSHSGLEGGNRRGSGIRRSNSKHQKKPKSPASASRKKRKHHRPVSADTFNQMDFIGSSADNLGSVNEKEETGGGDYIDMTSKAIPAAAMIPPYTLDDDDCYSPVAVEDRETKKTSSGDHNRPSSTGLQRSSNKASNMFSASDAAAAKAKKEQYSMKLVGYVTLTLEELIAASIMANSSTDGNSGGSRSRATSANESRTNSSAGRRNNLISNKNGAALDSFNASAMSINTNISGSNNIGAIVKDRHTTISITDQDISRVLLYKDEEDRRKAAYENHQTNKRAVGSRFSNSVVSTLAANNSRNNDDDPALQFPPEKFTYHVKTGSVMLQKQPEMVCGVPLCSALRLNMKYKSYKLLLKLVDNADSGTMFMDESSSNKSGNLLKPGSGKPMLFRGVFGGSSNALVKPREDDNNNTCDSVIPFENNDDIV